MDKEPNTGTYICVFTISDFGVSHKLSFEMLCILKWYL